MTRRKKSGLRSALALVSVTALITSVLQQVVTVRYLMRRDITDKSTGSSQAATSAAAPRWVGLRPTPGTLSPVLPQHPHAATGGASRRAHIV